jgi:tyrosinase
MTTPPSAPFVRQDIWLLQPEGAAFHPIVLAYAEAVAVLKQNAGPSPHRWWRHQTQVHGLSPDPRDGLRNQCQHNSWFFLPWHRMYLFFFESICRSIIQGLPGVPDAIKETWALPYWDYDRTDARLLPPAFRAEFIDGDLARPNPLFDTERDPDINSGAIGLTPFETTASGWFRALPYAARFPNGASFGGPETAFHHFSESGNASPGPLERTPHGNVHVTVGGLNGKMGDFNRAAGDPIFWLHHANIDRLWEIWRANTGAGQDPVDLRFAGQGFAFLDASGTRTTLRCGNVLNTLNLNYTYADMSVPASSGRAPTIGQLMPRDINAPPQTLGSIDSPMSLARGLPTTIDFDLSDFKAVVMEDPADPRRVLLSIDHITGAARPTSVFGVFAEPDDGGEAAYLGSLPMFGMAEANAADAEHGLSYVFDVTDTMMELLNAGRWEPTHIRLAFAPINEAARMSEDVGEVSIGSVSVMAQ